MTTAEINYTIKEVIITNEYVTFDYVIVELTDIKKSRRRTDRYMIGYRCKDSQMIHFDNSLSTYIEHNFTLPTITLTSARKSCNPNVFKGFYDMIERANTKGNISLANTHRFFLQEAINKFYERTGVMPTY